MAQEKDPARDAIEDFCGRKQAGIVHKLGGAASKYLIKVGDRIVDRLTSKSSQTEKTESRDTYL